MISATRLRCKRSAINDRKVVGLRIKESPWAPAWYDDADDLGEFLRG